jgi:hypothetical protein
VGRPSVAKIYISCSCGPVTGVMIGVMFDEMKWYVPHIERKGLKENGTLHGDIL